MKLTCHVPLPQIQHLNHTVAILVLIHITLKTHNGSTVRTHDWPNQYQCYSPVVGNWQDPLLTMHTSGRFRVCMIMKLHNTKLHHILPKSFANIVGDMLKITIWSTQMWPKSTCITNKWSCMKHACHRLNKDKMRHQLQASLLYPTYTVETVTISVKTNTLMELVTQSLQS